MSELGEVIDSKFDEALGMMLEKGTKSVSQTDILSLGRVWMVIM
jgi:hypothetical protein